MELIIPNDIDKESKYKEFNNLVRELGYPTLEMYLSTEITDKDGNIISTRKGRAHSWTRNAYNCLLSNLASKGGDGTVTFGGGVISGKTTAGTIYGYDNAGLGVKGIYAAAGITYGIVAGTSDAGYSFEDYKLTATIAHGNGAGQMSYSAMVNVGFVWSTVVNPSDTGTATIKRYLNNNSGNSIDVNEIGLIYYMQYYMDNYFNYFLVARDVLASTDSVPDTAQYTITYTIVITLPE